MTFEFHKYQGTGNDFVIIDNRKQFFPKDNIKLVKTICDRKFGVGADGLILLENHPEVDFLMVYYNADGRPSSMCGNGGRCIVAFAKALQIINEETVFEAVDGLHNASVKEGKVHLKMQDVSEIKEAKDYLFLDTGSPHHIQTTDTLTQLNVKEEGSRIRYSSLYGEVGSNINFVEKKGENTFAVRTYERGVEDETLSCGTGVTAVALAMYHTQQVNEERVQLEVEGGALEVTFEASHQGYSNIYLIGPATLVFKGQWEC